MAKTKLISLLFLFLQLKNAVDGAAYIITPQEKPAKYACLEGCYIPDLDQVLAYESSYYPPGSCSVYQCASNGYTTFYSCGVIAPPEGCELVPGDTSLIYPECCDDLNCNAVNDPQAEEPIPDPNGMVAPPIVEPPLEEPDDTVPV